MSQATEGLPGFWRFTWLFWMQPITLHRLLRSLGIDPLKRGWKLLRQRSPVESWYLVSLARMLLIGPGLVFTVGGFLYACGVPIKLADVARGVAVSLSGVAVGVGVGIAEDAAAGIAYGVAAGVIGGIAATANVNAFAIVAAGMVASTVAFGVGIGVAFGDAVGIAVGVAFGVFVGAYVGVVTGGGGAGRVAAGVAAAVTFLGLPVLVLEAIVQVTARCWSAVAGRRTLTWAPVLYHDLSYVPHPLLQSHLLSEADADPVLTRRVLAACSIAPGQRRTGRKVEAKLRARELKRLAEAKDFQAIAESRGTWLPGVQGADGVLLGFSEAGRYLAAASAAFNAHHQLTHLDGFATQLNALENQLRASRTVFTQPFEESLSALSQAGRALRAVAEKNAAGLIPNRFRAGDPLSGEAGPELFRGREMAVRDIEEILSDPNRSASLQLLAPRRSGKTSLLKMLPAMLPDAVCVFFDLQAHPAASVDHFLKSLAAQAAIQAKRDRRVDLPPLPDGPPMEAAEAWLEQLDRLPDGRRVLIAIDEFERLEDLFPGSRREFLQLMGLFRATIQHRRNVRLLVSGAARFDELDRVWDDHFISARQVKLPFLDRPTSIGLLSQPAPDFPAGTISEDVAAEVYTRTGGQPFLLQVYGSLLVSRLNDEKRKAATLSDVQAVEGRAIEWAEGYFRDLYKWAPQPAREGLGRLAREETVALAPATRRWLAQQYLLTSEDRLAIPVFAAWIEHHALV